jgi:hypothetical protein
MSEFQVQYKYNSKTHTLNLYSSSYQKVRDFVQEIIGGEITEIREFVHTDNTIQNDNNNYVHSKTITLANDMGLKSLRIPKIKKSVTDEQLFQLVRLHLKHYDKKVESAKIATKF